ncbi:hypothetical protein CDAR_258381 [Caerostris darwini]|uniref:Uncharacterized protein n=1 Tax=Caerostris darwini TaxID=1538125 RepID=A0AAV4V604_9ARAC|nr:hypothetical protein CDAR_258381 [Caerostris darwini]
MFSQKFFFRRKKQRSAQLSLLADFLANRLSAAGVAHVVKRPSPLRRGFWFVILLLTLMGMSYMTYRVLQEYLAYPTVMRSKVRFAGKVFALMETLKLLFSQMFCVAF